MKAPQPTPLFIDDQIATANFIDHVDEQHYHLVYSDPDQAKAGKRLADLRPPRQHKSPLYTRPVKVVGGA